MLLFGRFFPLKALKLTLEIANLHRRAISQKTERNYPRKSVWTQTARLLVAFFGNPWSIYHPTSRPADFLWEKLDFQRGLIISLVGGIFTNPFWKICNRHIGAHFARYMRVKIQKRFEVPPPSSLPFSPGLPSKNFDVLRPFGPPSFRLFFHPSGLCCLTLLTLASR